MSAASTPAQLLPETPYRGLEPYRFCDQSIFFERENEAERLLRLVTMYRGLLLYGESGAGKSSLINAGFIPKAKHAGMQVERLRVQPRSGQEFVLERIARSTTVHDFLPSALAGLGNQERTTLDATSFLQAVCAASQAGDLLLIFDQFEELLTLTAEAGAAETQQRIVDTLVGLLQDRQLTSLRLLFVFREDYLAKFDRLFYLCPELPDRFLRLTPPPISALHRILRGPFESGRIPPDYWKHALPEAITADLERQLLPAGEGARINLSRVQIAALQLWRSADPTAMLARHGVDGLVDQFLREQLATFRENREIAEALLALMITRQGTRKVVAEGEILEDLAKVEHIRVQRARPALDRLVNDTRLVRRDFNRGVTTYEIVSEFLVPWIRTLKLQRSARKARNTWLLRAAVVCIGLGGILASIFYWKYTTTTEAARRTALVQEFQRKAEASESRAASLRSQVQALQKALESNANDREKQLLDALKKKTSEADQERQRSQDLLRQMEKTQKGAAKALEEEKNGRRDDQSKSISVSSQLNLEILRLKDQVKDLEAKLKVLPKSQEAKETPSRESTPVQTAERQRVYRNLVFVRLDDLTPLPNLSPAAYLFVSKPRVAALKEYPGRRAYEFCAVLVPEPRADSKALRDVILTLHQVSPVPLNVDPLNVEREVARQRMNDLLKSANVQVVAYAMNTNTTSRTGRSTTADFEHGGQQYQLVVSFDASPPIAMLFLK